MTKTMADISACGRYRYSLLREWDDNEPPLVVVGLNPSTADANADDPTIRRCIGFAKRERSGGLLMLNLFALRSTNPKALAAALDPVGPDNDRVMGDMARMAAEEGVPIVCAWGNGGLLLYRDVVVTELLRKVGTQLLVFGLTGCGQPKHPLYLAAATPLVAWDCKLAAQGKERKP